MPTSHVTNSVFSKILDTSGKLTGAQYPLPTSNEQVFAIDVDDSLSDIGDFSGCVCEFFSDRSITQVNSTSDNPKIITIIFEKPIITSILGFGTESGDFSNTVIKTGSFGVPSVTVLDESADSTKKTNLVIVPVPLVFTRLILEFHTADTVSIGAIAIAKAHQRISRIQGIAPSGVVKNVNVTEDGNLAVSDESSGLSIAQGNVAGTSFIHKFGNAPNFDTSDGQVTVWDGANDAGINQMVYQYSTSDDIDTISSSSGSDTQAIAISGLDINYDEVAQTLILEGQAKVTLNTPLRRVYRMVVVGSTGLVGDAYLYEDTAIVTGVPVDTTKVRAVARAGQNQTLMALYTIPAGKKGYMRSWFASTAGGTKDSAYAMTLKARPINQTFQTKHLSSISDVGSSYIQHQYIEPEVFLPLTDIEMMVESIASPGVSDASVSSGFDIVLVDN